MAHLQISSSILIPKRMRLPSPCGGGGGGGGDCWWSPSLSTKDTTTDHHHHLLLRSSTSSKNPTRRRGLTVRCESLSEMTGGPAPPQQVVVSVGRVTEVNKDTFWPLVKAAATIDKNIVVVDMYTQWCGPCKVMAPKFQQLSEEHLDVVFLKLDCNQENKPLAKELGIKVVPTFKILKDGKIVKEVTGAKFDNLVLAIEDVKSS